MTADVIRHADEVIAAALVCMAKAEMILHDHATRKPLVAEPVARPAAEGEEKMS